MAQQKVAPRETVHFMDQDPTFAQTTLPVLASILQEVCQQNDQRQAPVVTKFHAASVPPISIFDYLKRIYDFASVSDSVFVMALILIDRLQRNPLLIVQTLNVHRLIITAVMASAKFLDDHYFNNAFYARIGGLSLREINSLELELLFVLNFDLTVRRSDFDLYRNEIQRQLHHSQHRAASEDEEDSAEDIEEWSEEACDAEVAVDTKRSAKRRASHAPNVYVGPSGQTEDEDSEDDEMMVDEKVEIAPHSPVQQHPTGAPASVQESSVNTLRRTAAPSKQSTDTQYVNIPVRTKCEPVAHHTRVASSPQTR